MYQEKNNSLENLYPNHGQTIEQKVFFWTLNNGQERIISMWSQAVWIDNNINQLWQCTYFAKFTHSSKLESRSLGSRYWQLKNRRHVWENRLVCNIVERLQNDVVFGWAVCKITNSLCLGLWLNRFPFFSYFMYWFVGRNWEQTKVGLVF